MGQAPADHHEYREAGNRSRVDAAISSSRAKNDQECACVYNFIMIEISKTEAYIKYSFINPTTSKRIHVHISAFVCMVLNMKPDKSFMPIELFYSVGL